MYIKLTFLLRFMAPGYIFSLLVCIVYMKHTAIFPQHNTDAHSRLKRDSSCVQAAWTVWLSHIELVFKKIIMLCHRGIYLRRVFRHPVAETKTAADALEAPGPRVADGQHLQEPLPSCLFVTLCVGET